MDGIQSHGYEQQEAVRLHSLTDWRRIPDEQSQRPTSLGLLDVATKGLLDYAVAARPLSFRLHGSEEIFKKLVERWELNDLAANVLLGSDSSVARRHTQRVLIGRERIKSDDEKERVAELFKIFQIVHSLFRDPVVEKAFLNEPQERLGGTSPIELISSGSWPKVIKARQFIELLAGL